jgi:hypothetical protein
MKVGKRLARALSICLVGGLALACQASAPGKRTDIGMTVHYRDADAASIERQFDLMAGMHVKWVRVDLDWAWMEKEQGQIEWAYPDKVVEEAKDRGMNVLCVLASTPAWARTSAPGNSATTPYSRPTQLSDLGNFVRTAAQRYSSRGVHNWEVWNEPNIKLFWPPQPDAQEYGNLFRVVATAIRGVDPQATILTGGLSPRYDLAPTEVAPTDYLAQLYENGTAQLADAVAIHPYSFPAMPMSTSQRNIIGSFKDLPSLHALMESHADAKKKIWITEYGAPTGTGPNSVSEKEQAAALLQARDQFGRWDWSGPLIYYELVDGGSNAAENGENFGVLHQDLAPKPAADALMNSPSS